MVFSIKLDKNWTDGKVGMDAKSNSHLNITIPPMIDFASLKLRRNPNNGHIEFRRSVLIELLKMNDVYINDGDPRFSELTWNIIFHWYCSHVHRGGKTDAVMESLMEEMMLEDKAGSLSFPSGHA